MSSKKMQNKKKLFLREIQIIKKLDHPNVIRSYDVFQDAKYLYIVQEFCSGSDISTLLSKKYKFAENQVAKFMRQILQAAAHMHSSDIAHRDLKPENILFKNNKHEEIKIIDFGLSAKLWGEKKLDSLVGTPYYCAPEILYQQQYDKAVDVWSLGVIMYEMLLGFHPFDGKSHKELYTNIKKRQFEVSLQKAKNKGFMSTEAADLIDKMLKPSPKERISAQDCLNHKWFKTLKSQQTLTDSRIQQNDEFQEQISKLLEFKGQNLFQQEVMKVFVTHLSDAQIKELQKNFSAIDKDKNGYLTVEELQQVLSNMGYSKTSDEIKNIFRNINPRNSKFINHTDFIRATMKRKSCKTDQWWNLFQYFSNNQQFIRKNDLQDIFKRNGHQVSANQIEDMINEVDSNKDGKISYEEFRGIMEVSERQRNNKKCNTL